MNKKQLYESIMRNVSREVKKALNEQRRIGIKMANAIGDERHVYILIDASGSMYRDDINLDKMNKDLMHWLIDRCAAHHTLYHVGTYYDYIDENIQTTDDVYEIKNILYDITMTQHHCGGTDCASAIRSLINMPEFDGDLKNYVYIITDMEDDMNAIKKALYDFKGLLEGTVININKYID